MIQYVIVALLFLTSLAYLGLKLWRTVKSKSDGCEGCAHQAAHQRNH